MAQPQTHRSAEEKKEQLVQELMQVRGEIMAEIQRWPPSMMDTAFLGTWSIKDLLAHLVGWDVTNRKAVAEILHGQVPSFYEHHDRDWASYNARLVAEYRLDNMERLLENIETTHRELLAYLQQVPALEWFEDRGLRFRGDKILISRLLAVEAVDEREHLEQIRLFLRQVGGIALSIQ